MEESIVIPIRTILMSLGFDLIDGEWVHKNRGTVVSEAYALDYMRDLIWDGEGPKVTRPSWSRTAVPYTKQEYDAARFGKIIFTLE